MPNSKATLNEQFKHFGNSKTLPKESPVMVECHALNNRIAIAALDYIIKNKCRLEHRSSLESDNWKPGTIRELLKYMLSGNKDNLSLNTWILNFWRVKTRPIPTELELLVTIDEKEEP